MTESISENSMIEEEEEEDGYSDNDILHHFGHEFNYTYSGADIEQLTEIRDYERDGVHLLLSEGSVLDHRYIVKKVIGHGTFCIVWMAWDTVEEMNVAIKIIKLTSEEDCESAQDEYILNRYLSDKMTPGVKVLRFYRIFFHQRHPCLVFELVQQNTLTFIDYFDSSYVRIPQRLIKKVVKDILLALDFLHKNGVIHTDLKPENVVANKSLFPYKPFDEDTDVFHPVEDDPCTVDFKLGDIGNSCFIHAPLNSLIQTRQYRSPEVLLQREYDYSADIWSLACMTFEFTAHGHLFNPIVLNSEEEEEEETNENKDMFDSIHLSLIEAVIGRIPEEWAKEGKSYHQLFNEKGDLIYTDRKIENKSIYELLQIRAGVSQQEAQELADFLEPMLSIIPEQRPSAEELLLSPYLHDI